MARELVKALRGASRDFGEELEVGRIREKETKQKLFSEKLFLWRARIVSFLQTSLERQLSEGSEGRLLGSAMGSVRGLGEKGWRETGRWRGTLGSSF